VRQELQQASLVTGPGGVGGGGAAGLAEKGEAELWARLERERHRRTSVGQVEEAGDERLLILDILMLRPSFALDCHCTLR
jgi:hypothetical protein